MKTMHRIGTYLLTLLSYALFTWGATAQASTETLASSSLVEGPSAGSDSVILTLTPPTGAWTATANAAWLHVAAGSTGGAGSANVLFRFDANPGATRTGTFTIAGKTLTVTQAGSTYVAASSITTLVASALGLDNPIGVAVDAAGNVYIADTYNNAIEEYSPATQSFTTLVSSGLNVPTGVAVDASGNVYIADSYNNAVEEYSPTTQAFTTLVSSGLSYPGGVAVDSSGNVYIADTNNSAIKEYSPATRTVTTLVSSGLANPSGVAVDASGNVYIADTGNSAVEEYSPATQAFTTLVSSGLSYPSGVAVDGSGNVLIADYGLNAIEKYAPATKTVTTLVSSGVIAPQGVAVDASGNLYIADTGNNAIEELPRAFLVPTAKPEPDTAGSDSLPGVVPATASLTGPFAPTSNQGWLTIGAVTGGVVDFSYSAYPFSVSRTAQITLLGQPVTVPQGSGSATYDLDFGFGVAANFDLSSGTGGAGATYSVSPALPAGLTLNPSTGVISGTPTALLNPVLYTFTATNAGGSTTVTLAIGIVPPYALGATALVEGAGAGSDSVILSVTPPSNSWTAAANASWLHVTAGSASGAGDAMILFSFDANTGATRTGTFTIGGETLTITQAGSTYVAAGSIAAVVTSGLYNPTGVAVDASGNVYIADTYNSAIKEYSPTTQTVTTLVSSGIATPGGVAVDASGNVYIADTGNSAIEVYSPTTQTVTTLVSAGLNSPQGVAVDAFGNVYIADTYNNAIKEYSPATQFVTTLVYSGLNLPQGVAVDAFGNVYIADTNNNAIKEYSPATQSVTALVSSGLNLPQGVAVDALGHVYIADTGNVAVEEYSPATQSVTTLISTGLSSPGSVVVDGSGNVYIADAGNDAIEELPRAFFDPSAKSEPDAAGSDSLPVVVPATATLAGPFAPTSDQSWLTIGATASGVVDFSFSAYPFSIDRTAHITLFGQPIAVTQGAGSATSNLVFDFGVAVDFDLSSGAGGAGTTYSVSPALPAGLTLNPATGVISGTPTGLAIPAAYTFKATHGSGSTTVTLIIGIFQPYVLGTSSLAEGPSAGSDSVILAVTPATNTWTAAANASWLHITAGSASGAGSTNVLFSFDANAGATRTGTLTIAGQTLTVIQAGSSYVAANSLATLVSAGLSYPSGMAVDGSGNVYIADSDNNAIKEYSPATQTVATLVSAGLSYPFGVALDASGNVYIANTDHSAIDEYSPTTHTDSALVVAGLTYPSGVAVDASGNVYIADTDDNAIKEYSPATGTVTTLVSSGLANPEGVAVDASGNVYIADTGNNAIEEYSPATQTVTSLVSSGLISPTGVAVDGSGNVYIADTNDNAIKEYSPATQAVTTLVSSGLSEPYGVAVDTAGNVYIADSGNGAIKELPRAFLVSTAKSEPDTAGSDSLPGVIPATASLSGIFAPTSDQSWLTIGATAGGVVDFSFPAYPFSIDRTAHINLFGQSIAVTQGTGLATSDLAFDLGGAVDLDLSSGAGGTGISYSVSPTLPTGLTLNPATGVISGTPTALAIPAAYTFKATNGSGSTTVTLIIGIFQPYALGMSALAEGPGAGSDSVVLTVTPATNTWTAAANASWLHVTAGSASGAGSANVLFSFDANTGATRAGTLTIAGQTLTVTQAGSAYVAANSLTPLVSAGLSHPTGAAVDASGNVYIADSDNNAIKEYSPATQTVATLVSAGLSSPFGVAVDASGNVYIANSGNNAIKEYSPATETVTTLVSSGLSYPSGVALDSSGNVYIADTDNNAIKEYSPATETVTTLVSSGLSYPSGVALDASGNVYIADTDDNAIKEYSPATQTVSTLVSSGLNNPYGVAVDGSGNVYIVDTDVNTIKKYSPATQAVTTLVSAGLSDPSGVAVDNAGNIYIADSDDDAIKELPRAFFDLTAKPEPDTAGSDSLAGVVPATASLTGPFAPTSDQPWLTIGAATGGVVDFSFPADPFSLARTAHINLLGRQIAVTQGNGLSTTELDLDFRAPVNLALGSGAESAGTTYSVSPSLPPGLTLNPATGTLSGTPTALTEPAVYTFTATSASGSATLTLVIGIVQPYALAATSLVEGPSAGSDSVLLTVTPSTGAWTSTANASWLHVTEGSASGAGSATIFFTFDANSRGTRSGTFTIGGQTLTVTQAGSTYVAAGSPTPLVSSGLNSPTSVAVDSSGNVYLADFENNAIKEYSPGLQTVATLVSSGLANPEGVAVDGSGNVYIADTYNGAIKEYSPATQTVTTLVSSGLSTPFGVAVDAFGNVYIADTGNSAIKEYSPATQTVTTLVSSGLNYPQGVAVDAVGNVYIADTYNNAVREYSPATQAISYLANLYQPVGVTVDGSGNVYIALGYENMVEEWTPATQSAAPLLSGLSAPQGVAVDGAGNLYIADTGGNAVEELPRAFVYPTAKSESDAGGSDSVPGVVPANLNLTGPFTPTSSQSWLTIGPVTGGVVGFSFPADSFSVARTAYITLLGQQIAVTQGTTASTYELALGLAVNINLASGSGGAGTTYSISPTLPAGLSLDPNAGVLSGAATALTPPTVYTVTATNAGGSTTVMLVIRVVRPYALGAASLVEGPGAGNDSVILTVTPPTGAWTAAANAPWLHLTASNSSGVGSANIFFSFDANSGPTRVGSLTIGGQTLAVTQAGSTYTAVSVDTTLIASGLSNPPGVAVDVSGSVYVADSGNNAIEVYSPVTQVVSTLIASGLSQPSGVAIGASGNVYIADTGNNAIKEYSPTTQVVTTLVASGLNNPTGVALDALGNVYIADSGDDAIKEYSPATQAVTTLVSGLNNPQGVAVDAAANVYIADSGNDAVKEWTAATGAITTLVSTGLGYPAGVAVDGSGNVYIADSDNNTIVKYSAAAGSDSLLVSSGISGPSGVAVDGAGRVYIADTGNSAVEELPRAFVDLTAKLEPDAAGADALPAAVPFAISLAGPFTPASDQSWLTIGAVTGGVVNFSFTSYPFSVARTAHITLLGEPIAVTQGTAAATYELGLGLAVNLDLASGAEAAGTTYSVSPGLPAGLSLNPSTGVLSGSPTALTAAGVYTITATNGSGSATVTLVIGIVQPFALGVTSLVEGPAAGVDSVLLTVTPSAGAWTAASNASWLHVTAGSASGVGDANIFLSFDANTGPTRTGTFTIAGQALTMTQAGSAYTAASSVTTLASGVGSPAGVAVDASGNVYIADYEDGTIYVYSPATQTTSVLVSSGLVAPTGVAVDASGNVYIADDGSSTIEVYSPATRALSTLVSSGLNNPYGVAVDASENVYIADSGNNAIEVYSPITQAVSTLVSGLNNPQGVAVDASGNVYIADSGNNIVRKWTASTQTLSTLVAPGFGSPASVAVDGSGNVYIANSSTYTVEKYAPATQILSTLASVSSGLSNPTGVAVDGSGNVYVADQGNNTVEELPRAFLDLTPLSEPDSAGSDALPTVVPSGISLTGPFAPASDQSWLSIDAVPSGVVDFSFSADPLSVARTAHLTVLGQPIAVIQGTGASTYELGKGVATSIDLASGSGGAGFTYLVSPSLPTGLSLNRTTGELSGTPTGLSEPTVYTITASKGGATVTVTLIIGVVPPFALASTALVEGPSAGSDSVVLTVAPPTGAWTAAANASWLHVAAGSASGAGSANVCFSFDANSGATRTGTLTVAGLTLTVTQAGAAYVAASAVTAVIPGVLANPQSVAVDSSGNVYIADTDNNAIKKYTAATQTISTLVSSGLNRPGGVAVDAAGNVYIADSNNNAIKEYAAATQTVAILVSSGLSFPQSVAVDATGNVYIADTSNSAIKEYSPATQTVKTLVSSGLNDPYGVAVDASGNVYIADSSNNAVKEYSPAKQTVTTVISSGLSFPQGLAVDASGNIYIADPGDRAIEMYAADTHALTSLVSSGLIYPEGVALDSSGNIYIADTFNQSLDEYSAATQTLATLASSVLNNPSSIAVDGSGNVYIANTETDTIDEYSAATHTVSQLVTVGAAGSIAVDAFGNVYIADTANDVIEEYSPATQTFSTVVSSGLGYPVGLAVDGYGNIYIADSGNNAIETFTAATQTLSTLVSGLNGPTAVAVDASGNVYIAESGNETIEEYSPVTQTVSSLVSSGLENPTGLAVDGSGNVYIASSGNSVIKVYSPATASVSTLVSSPFSSLAVDGSGNLYLAETDNSALNELPRAFLSPTAKSETDAAGSDTLPAVVPTSFSLTGPFTPASDQSWLTIGGVTNGAVSFSFTADSFAVDRTAQITLLGQPIAIVQGTEPSIYEFGLGVAATYDVSSGGGSATYSVSSALPAGLTLNPTTGVITGTPTALGGPMLYTVTATNASGSTAVSVIFGVGPPYLLGAATLIEGPSAGNDAVLLSVNPPSGAWTATANASWLHVTTGSASGAGNASILFSFDANGGAPRTGTCTIGGQTLTVTQAGSGYVAADALAPLIVPSVNGPAAVAVDASGNVYFADTLNNAVKKYTAATQSITTLVSSGLGGPQGVAVDASGNVYIADTDNNAVEEYSAATQTLTTLVSSGLSGPQGVAVDASGNVYIADTYNNAIKEYSPATQAITTLVSSGLDYPEGVAVDSSGNVYIADTDDSAIKKYTASSRTVSTLISSGVFYPEGVAVDSAGNVYIAEPGAQAIMEYSPATQALTTLVSSGLDEPSGVAVDGSGDVYIADSSNNAIKEYAAASQAVTTLVASSLSHPAGVAADRAGNLYYADSGSNSIKEYEIATGGVATLVSSGLNLHPNPDNGPNPAGLAVDAAGNIYIADPGNDAIERYSATAKTLTTLVTGLSTPSGVAVDAFGNVYIADSGNGAIEEYNATTQRVSTLASGLNYPEGVAVDASGNVYIADSGNAAIKVYNPVTQAVSVLVSAGLSYPSSLAVDGSGNVYIADGSTSEEYVAATGALVPLTAPSVDYVEGVAVDGSGNAYLAVFYDAIEEVQRAWVDSTTQAEPDAAGSDALPTVLPSTVSLTGPFAPISYESWLTLGSINGGIIDFSFSANSGSPRRGVLNVLGQRIEVTQGPPQILSITPNTASMAHSEPEITILGSDFSTTPANDTVTFNNGAVGVVTAATATHLTVALSSGPNSLGALMASVAVAGVGAAGPTQVATVVGAPANAQLYVGQYDTGGVGEYNTSNGTAIDVNFITGLAGPDALPLAISGNTLYVANNLDNPPPGVVGEYNASTGAAINASFITGLASPSALAVSGNLLFVASSTANTVSEYNATTGAVINANFITGLNVPSALAVFGSNLLVANAGGGGEVGAVSEYDVSTGELINASFIPAIYAPTALAISGNCLFVASSSGVGGIGAGGVGEYDATTGAAINPAFIPGLQNPSGLAILGYILFVAEDTGSNVPSVLEYDAATGRPMDANFISGTQFGDGARSIAVAAPAVSLSYTADPAAYTKGVAIPANLPNSAEQILSYSVSPPLPLGLGLDSNTGIISGTPTAVTPAAVYTVTAITSSGSATASLTIAVDDVAPSALAYFANPAIYTKGAPITNNTPGNSGGAVVSYLVSPPLPAGLTLNMATGVISGAPTGITPTAAYTVTASNTGGFTTASLTITVNDAPPSSLTYSANPVTYTKGTAIPGNTPSSSGGAVVSYSVSPSLPAGLTLSTTTGIITGTPSAPTLSAAYIVTATNTGGSTTASLMITVDDVAPSLLAYSANPATYRIGTAIAGNQPSNSGGAVVSYTVSPSLPAGLSLSGSTGVVSGTPTAITSTASYTVTATNSGGFTTASLSITIEDALPVATAQTLRATTHLPLSITLSATEFITEATTYQVLTPPLNGVLSGSAPNLKYTSTATFAGVDSFTFQATDSGGTSAPATVTINVFPPVSKKGYYSGNYVGLIAGADAAHSGTVSITSGGTGAFTGSLVVGGVTYPLKGSIPPNGDYPISIRRKGLSTLTGNLSFGLPYEADVITGAFDGSTLVANNAVFSATAPTPNAGAYTVMIPPDPTQTNGVLTPQGYGVGKLSVTPSGSIKFVGALADGTSFSRGTSLTRGGVWYLFLPLYASTGPLEGMLEGTIQFENTPQVSNLDGAVTWIRPALIKTPYPSSALYPTGFSLATHLYGAAYNPKESLVLTLDSANNTFLAEGGDLGGGSLSEAATAGKAAASLKVTGADSLSLTVTTASGFIMGSFKQNATVNGRTVATSLPVNAIIYQGGPAPSIVGWFTNRPVAGTNEAGAVALTSP